MADVGAEDARNSNIVRTVARFGKAVALWRLHGGYGHLYDSADNHIPDLPKDVPEECRIERSDQGIGHDFRGLFRAAWIILKTGFSMKVWMAS